jgi:apolipoprotein N-acyltransferase
MFATLFSKQSLLVLIAGAVSVLGFAPYQIFILPWLGLAVLFYAWQQVSNPKQAFCLGFSYGLGLYCVGIYWIYISLHDFGGMPWWFAGFCTFCLCAFMALFPALVGYLSKRLGWMVWSVPVLWGLSDWVRSWIFTGFPWLTMGYSQVPHSPLAGFMPILGVYGVSVLVALFGVLLALSFSHFRQKTRLQAFVPITLISLLTIGGLLKTMEWTSPVGKPLSVALLQGNIAQNLKWSPESAQTTISTYLNMMQASNAQLIVMPETALPIIYSELEPYVKDALVAKAKQVQGDVVVGMIEQTPQTGDYYNSAIGFNAEGVQSYRKNHLVPFGEFIPFKAIFGWIYRDWLNMPLSDLSRGGTHQPLMLTTQHQQLGVNVCYEDVFGEEIIRQLPNATLLVNISNDAWYGQSFAAVQHMQFSQARALETGRQVLRATNTGATAHINQQGYVLAHAPHDINTTLTTQAQGFTGSTPYVRWGNWPFIVFCLAVIGFVLRRKNK